MNSNAELLKRFEQAVAEHTKSVNGWNRKSERKLSEEIERLSTEILRRMDSK